MHSQAKLLPGTRCQATGWHPSLAMPVACTWAGEPPGAPGPGPACLLENRPAGGNGLVSPLQFCLSKKYRGQKEYWRMFRKFLPKVTQTQEPQDFIPKL